MRTRRCDASYIQCQLNIEVLHVGQPARRTSSCRWSSSCSLMAPEEEEAAEEADGEAVVAEAGVVWP